MITEKNIIDAKLVNTLIKETGLTPVSKYLKGDTVFTVWGRKPPLATLGEAMPPQAKKKNK